MEKKKIKSIVHLPLFGVCVAFLTVSFLLFTGYCLFKNTEMLNIATIFINAFVALVGFLAIHASIQNDKEIKRFEYIEDYNFNFLTNREFIRVERMLETCNQKYEMIDKKSGREEWSDELKKEFREFCDSIFGTSEYKYNDEKDAINTKFDKDGMISSQYQGIVNYLVYLEAFVPLLLQDQLKIEEVDDLFGYRYFIAMNNPVLQENELCKERSYYRGCFEIYDKWRSYREKDARGCVIPMKQYDLLKQWEEYKKIHQEAKE